MCTYSLRSGAKFSTDQIQITFLDAQATQRLKHWMPIRRYKFEQINKYTSRYWGSWHQ